MNAHQNAVPRRRFLVGAGLSVLCPSTAAEAVTVRPSAVPHRVSGAAGGADRSVPQPEQVLRCGAKAVALTFDDGPSPLYTPQVLAILRRYGIRATFFMLGANARKYPGVVRQVVEEGHVLGNHTWSHPALLTLTAAQVRDEIRRTNDVLAAHCDGRPPELFRAPGGHFVPASLRACAEFGLRPISWSLDTADWTNPGSKAIGEAVLTRVTTGSIVLHHDGVLSRSEVPEHQGRADRTQTVQALRSYIPQLLDRNYHFTTPC